jgi:hypothetical protein
VIGRARGFPNKTASQRSPGVSRQIAIATSAPTIKRPLVGRVQSTADVLERCTVLRKRIRLEIDIAERDGARLHCIEELVALTIDAGIADGTARVVPDSEARRRHQALLLAHLATVEYAQYNEPVAIIAIVKYVTRVQNL